MSNVFRHSEAVQVSNEELSDLVDFTEGLAAAAADVILPLFRSDLEIENKKGYNFFDPVTKADKGAEAAIRKLINERFPDHSIYGEEYGSEENASALTWTIDPIDGTRAFVLGLPVWGILIALHDGKKPILGMMAQPFLKERFIGVPQLGLAELRTDRGTRALKTRTPGTLSNASLTSTHPSMFDREPKRTTYKTLQESVRQHGYGGDCYAYGLVAMGTHDIVVENQLKPFDIQAMIPIIEAAGGKVTSWDGGPADLGGDVIASGDEKIHEEILKVLSS
jgi:histidinol-phosphatase